MAVWEASNGGSRLFQLGDSSAIVSRMVADFTAMQKFLSLQPAKSTNRHSPKIQSPFGGVDGLKDASTLYKQSRVSEQDSCLCRMQNGRYHTSAMHSDFLGSNFVTANRSMMPQAAV